MKKLLMICGLLFSMATFSQAQDAPARPRMGNPEERAKRQTEQLTERLKLNADQKAKVGAIYAEQAVSINKVREENREDRKAMMEAVAKSNEAAEAKITALLTEDQKKVFETWKEERKEMMKKRMEGRGGQAGPGAAKP